MLAPCRWRVALVWALLLYGGGAFATDLRLIMFDSPDCAFCARWEHDVGGIYARTDEGRQAPLTRAYAFGEAPEGVVLASPVQFTPTFVLLRDDVEIARIDGYLSEEQFWGLLGRALDDVVGE